MQMIQKIRIKIYLTYLFYCAIILNRVIGTFIRIYHTEREEGSVMKVKKRYLVACILITLVAVFISVVMFNMEMGLARYSKLNKTARESWLETSASDSDTRLNTDLFVTRVVAPEDIGDDVVEWKYLGKQTVVDGKYVAYDKDVYGNNIVINDDVKMGDRISIYFKPDEPTKIYVTTSTVPYIIGIAVCFVLGVALIFVCRIIGKHMKDNTFSDATVSFMDIPMAVIVAGLVLSFFAGMLMGNLQVDASYTNIDSALAERYANHELQF